MKYNNVNRGLPKHVRPSPMSVGGHAPHEGMIEGGGRSEHSTPS